MPHASSPLSSAPLLTDVLAGVEPLSPDERHQVVRQAQVLIEQVYVHLPLKRAMYAVDPVQRLRLLDRRLEGFSDRRFHDEMLSIFIGLRDSHTSYSLPRPFSGRTATLPFKIEACWEGDVRRYLVTGVVSGLDVPPFGLRVEVTHWAGIPIERAVALNGERTAGGNMDARHERGLVTLTSRPMGRLAPPEEEWVDVTFLAGGPPTSSASRGGSSSRRRLPCPVPRLRCRTRSPAPLVSMRWWRTSGARRSSSSPLRRWPSSARRRTRHPQPLPDAWRPRVRCRMPCRFVSSRDRGATSVISGSGRSSLLSTPSSKRLRTSSRSFRRTG